jgi:hypothetical protein
MANVDTGVETPTPSGRVIHADPTKDFFVTMITRDIPLPVCILDLLDNCIDGAHRSINSGKQTQYDAFEIELSFSEDAFEIKDNCGGILLSDAIDYAFHFGRRPDSPADVAGGIGLYGIGMKRAIFKMGRLAHVKSEAEDASFTVKVDVDAWERRTDNWDFEYEDSPRTGRLGTSIRIENLYPGVAAAFSDPVFHRELIKLVARDYAFFVEKGVRIRVGDMQVPQYRFQLRESAELSPAVEVLEDDGVSIRITAGLIDDLPEEIPDELKPDGVERFGWFVVCNNRVVLAGDKSDKTVWGDAGFQVWHPQYNGFAGFVFFQSDDQRKLPWTTTKHDLDDSNPIYRRAIATMKRITLEFIEYTNRRKADIERAKEAERPLRQINVVELTAPRPLTLPKLQTITRGPTQVTISYRRNRERVEQIKDHLGRPWMSAKDVGIHTFEFFVSTELGR